MTSQADPEPDIISTEKDLDKKFPNRPKNHSRTLPFHDLFLKLFNPLNENQAKKPDKPGPGRRQVGRHGPRKVPPQEARKNIIEQFISRWRLEVGDDIYPAFRLIMPNKDRERPMYGLKEKNIGKLLVKVMKIDKNSDDASTILNWKVPGKTASARMAGDFAGRCFEVLSKRPIRPEIGDMTIEEVNELLDKLSANARDEIQLPIFEEFYRRMNPDELMWLIRIILRQMKVGATEKTFLGLWHPDAESLYSVSSSLQRVCWELHDINLRLESDERDVNLMQCFQPQLAHFDMKSFPLMVARMKPTEEDPMFWVEEKLDGERMQLHMVPDDDEPGGKRFGFWSRKAKDYTYLYGQGFKDETSSLTRHIQGAFDDRVDDIILDGEMITWDMEQDSIAPFGTLKSAAISQQQNPFAGGIRPLYRVFDILYLNGKSLTRYTLRDRRNALEASVKSVSRRLEIHEYVEATDASEIEPRLRKVVAEAAEGLVLKNPRAAYKLNERTDDWIKVKPEYMTEFGESLDCVVIGGYYGSGNRGGRLSSFLCGLRVDHFHGAQPANSMKCWSFFKVGGGMTGQDYANIRHQTDGKWIKWDPKRPPTEYIELGGGELQYERPDEWIKPNDSVVLEVKAASVALTDQFRTAFTLRFPRFKRLRGDKDWKSALSIQEFQDLKATVERERDQKDKEFTVDDSRKKRLKLIRKPLTVAGYGGLPTDGYGGPSTEVFKGHSFYVVTDSMAPERRTKVELEQMIKANGGSIFQSEKAKDGILCIADRRTVKVAALQKSGNYTIIRPQWIFDCVEQSRIDAGLPPYLLELEPRHLFYASEKQHEDASERVDKFSDSYARDVSAGELQKIFETMSAKVKQAQVRDLRRQLRDLDATMDSFPGWIFQGLTMYFDRLSHNVNDDDDDATLLSDPTSDCRTRVAWIRVRFGGAVIAKDLKDETITHVVVNDSSDVKSIREALIWRKTLPRIVTTDFVEESWKEMTLLDEQRFAPS